MSPETEDRIVGYLSKTLRHEFVSGAWFGFCMGVAVTLLGFGIYWRIG